MKMKQETLRCANCGNLFVWSVEEQKLYNKRGISKPKYCPICRGMLEAEEKDKEERR